MPRVVVGGRVEDGERFHGICCSLHAVEPLLQVWLWRPVTAIANADKDGNDDTTADAAWTPLLATPNHPEYPSAHGCLDSALINAVAVVLGSNHVDVTVPGATNGGTTLTTTPHFDTAHEYQAQFVDARVWIGFHFRNSTLQGERLGNAVAAWTLDRYFQPVK